MRYQNMTEIIGNTPLMELQQYQKRLGLSATICAKLECFNPGGSAKDRIARAMLDDAAQKGLLRQDSVIIEPTSGNTGIGLAAVAAARGYRSILVMPDTMSVERRQLLGAYGAEIVLTPGALGMKGAIEKAQALAQALPHAFLPAQFENPANPQAHYCTTGPEIWADTQGKVDVFVAGVGTGGTLSGAGKFLKEQNPSLEIYAVEPADSAVLSGGAPGAHKLQGIGAGFVPQVLDTDLYDGVIAVKSADAYATVRAFAKAEGLLVGISSGATLWAATELAKREKYKGKVIVVILPDTGERYLSTGVFEA